MKYELFQVAKTLINPFGGEDDEDFDMEYLVNRNFQVGLLMIKEEEDLDTDDDLDESDLFYDASGDPPTELPTTVVKKPRPRKLFSLSLTKTLTKSLSLTSDMSPSMKAEENQTFSLMAIDELKAR